MADLPAVTMPVLGSDTDVAKTTRDFLNNLNLLPNEQDLRRAGDAAAIFGGPPQSVALTEAGATSVSKWWAAGAGAVLLGSWGSVRVFWDDKDVDSELIALPGIAAANLSGADSPGWMAIAMRKGKRSDEWSYLLVRGVQKEWVASSDVEFASPNSEHSDGRPRMVLELSD